MQQPNVIGSHWCQQATDAHDVVRGGAHNHVFVLRDTPVYQVCLAEVKSAFDKCACCTYSLSQYLKIFV